MQKVKLPTNFELYRWQSDETDLTAFPQQPAARILFNMFLINDFEHALLTLKNEGCVWGPVHTSVGQEAVAAALEALEKTDKVFATHRAHHQFLAKVLHYVLPESWNPVCDDLSEDGEVVVRRTLAEIMGLEEGYCSGRGGSMHLRYAEAGFLGSNAIVAGGIPLATGAAYAEKFNDTGNIVIAFFGDGAINQGAFHEACNLAGLWNLPIIFFLENNSYAVATHINEACAIEDLSLRAISYGMDAAVVDGNDTVAIYQTVKESAEAIRKGKRPCIIEAKCYRRYHHAGDQQGSSFGYRSKEEEAQWREKEAVVRFPQQLIEAGILGESDVEKIKEMASASVSKAVEYCTIEGTPRTVRPELYPKPESAALGLRSDGHEWASVKFSEREQFSEFREMRYSDTIAAVCGRWLAKDSGVFVLGEEVANFGGGGYGATKGLPEKYPERILNTPISEAGFVGLACGASMMGMRPVVEIMFPDFALVAADQLFNQVGKARHMYGNTTDLPIVVRTRVAIGCGYGGQHSMDPVGLYALFSGWRIVAPANGFDYVGLFNSAMQCLDPVLIIEHHSLYSKKFPVPAENLDYFIQFGKARVVANGEDVTIIAYGSMVGRCENLIAQLNAQEVSAEIIDLRTLDHPSIDYETIGESVRKTGAVVVVEEAAAGHSIGSEIAANITERFFDYLDAPVVRLASLDIPLSVSRVLEKAAVIDDQAIIETTVNVAKRK